MWAGRPGELPTGTVGRGSGPTCGLLDGTQAGPLRISEGCGRHPERSGPVAVMSACRSRSTSSRDRGQVPPAGPLRTVPPRRVAQSGSRHVVRVARRGVPGGGRRGRRAAGPDDGPAGDRARHRAAGAGPRPARQRRAGRTRHHGRGPRTTSTRCAPSPAGCDVLTFDHEHVPTAHLRTLEAEGVVVRPGPDALEHAQDKLVMRRRLTELGVAVPPLAGGHHAPTSSRRSVRRSAGRSSSRRPGADTTARGSAWSSSRGDADDWLAGAERPAPRCSPRSGSTFTRELAVLVARSPHGQAAVWPVVETVQVDGVCREVVAPAPITEDHALAAQQAALRIAEGLGVTGVMAVEMFDTDGGRARQRARDAPAQQRPLDHRGLAHQPVRAAPARRARPAARRHPDDGAVRRDGQRPGRRHRATCTPATCTASRTTAGVRIHMYGKEVRPGRKVGHVTTLGGDADDVRERARHAAAFLRGDIDE